MFAVGEHLNRAVAIRAQDAHMGRIEAGEQLRAGMAVGIFRASGDDGELRMDAGEKVICC